MSEQLRESLSAAMDDEADAFELRRVLDEAKQDDQLREQWHRFHLLRDVLQEQGHLHQPGLRESIWEQLQQPHDDAEQVAELVLAQEANTASQARSPWFGRITGTAVAAAVAIVVMIGGGVLEQTPETADFAGVETAGPAAEATPVMYSQATARDQQRQNGLMLHHFQQRAMNQASLASFVKVATFSSTPPARAAGAQPQANEGASLEGDAAAP